MLRWDFPTLFLYRKKEVYRRTKKLQVIPPKKPFSKEKGADEASAEIASQLMSSFFSQHFFVAWIVSTANSTIAAITACIP
jgi:hypothetical protein